MAFTVTRRIEIDAGHRIATHGSKCRHIHGHRYRIEATARATELHRGGEQADMVLDFGFLKEEMMRVIDACCDHGFMAAADDADILDMFRPVATDASWAATLQQQVARDGFALTEATRMATKLYLLPFQPTAEALARHWFERLAEPVRRRSDGLAELVKITVYETPNCAAEYEG